MYCEQFYCFPLKNHFLGEAGKHLAPPALSPLQTEQLLARHHPHRLTFANDRKGGQPVQLTFTEGPGLHQALAQPAGDRGGKETVPALRGLGDGCRAAMQCPRAQSQAGEKDVQ